MGETATQTDRRVGSRPDPELPRPLWSLRRVSLVVGLPLLVLAAIVVVNLLDRRELATTTLPAPIDRIVVQVARGDVELVPAQPGTADVVIESTSRWRFVRPEVEVSPDGNVARVNGSCPRIVLVVGVCSVDFVIEVPAGVQVFVRTDDGSVQAQGLDGWTRLTTSGGAVSAVDMRGPELLVESDGGPVDVEMTSPPSRIEVQSGGGAVSIVVPDHESYDVRTAGSTGEVDVGIEDVNDAERVIRVRGGDVTIRPS